MGNSNPPPNQINANNVIDKINIIDLNNSQNKSDNNLIKEIPKNTDNKNINNSLQNNLKNNNLNISDITNNQINNNEISSSVLDPNTQSTFSIFKMDKLMLSFLSYPLFRRVLEKKLITSTPRFKVENLKNLTKIIQEKGGHFSGLKSFVASRFFAFLLNDYSHNFIVQNILLSFGLFLSYPLFVNSNIKALNLPGYASLKNFSDLKQLFMQRNSYKGFRYYLISQLLFFIPFLNYFSHRFEAIRLAYVFGPYLGNDFKNYKDARLYLKTKKGFKHGRFMYNLLPNFINLMCIIYLSIKFQEEGDSINNKENTQKN